MLSSNLIKSGAMTTMAALFAFVGNIMLARMLPQEAYGEVSLIITVFNLLSIISSFGQPGLTKRRILTNGMLLNWRKDLSQYGLIAILLSSTISIVLMEWYHFSFLEIVFIVIFSIATSLIAYCIIVLDCLKSFLVPSLLQRLPFAMILLLLPFFHFNVVDPTSISVLLFLSLFYFISVTVGFWKLTTVAYQGTTLTKWYDRLTGFNFLMLSLAGLLPYYGLSAVVGKITSTESFAIFSAMMLFQRPFYILNNVMNRILAVTWKSSKKNTIRDYIVVLVFGAMLTILIVFTKSQIITAALGEKFLVGQALILPFMLSGILVIADTLPRTYVLNYSPDNVVRIYTRVQVSISVAAILVILYFITDVVTIAWIGVFLLLAKVIISFLFSLRWHQN